MHETLSSVPKTEKKSSEGDMDEPQKVALNAEVYGEGQEPSRQGRRERC
jgi:hypothetical protein